MVHPCKASTQEMEAGGTGDQGYAQLYRDYVDTVDYMRQGLKKEKKKIKKRPRESSINEKFLLYQKIQSSVPSTLISQVTTTGNSSTRGIHHLQTLQALAHMCTYPDIHAQ